MGHVAKGNEWLRNGKHTWVCTCVCDSSCHPLQVSKQKQSPAGGWHRAFPGTRACVAVPQSRTMGVRTHTQAFCWEKLRQNPQGRAAGDLWKTKQNKIKHQPNKTKQKTEEGGASHCKKHGQAAAHHAVAALLSQCTLEELFGYHGHVSGFFLRVRCRWKF